VTIVDDYWKEKGEEDRDILRTTEFPPLTREELDFWLQLVDRTEKWKLFSRFGESLLTGLASEASCERLFSRI
jgi:hypothetical protein